MEMKSFHISDVLSLSTGIMVSFDGFGGLMRILNFMTGKDLWVTEIIEASPAMRPVIIEQFPWLAGIPKPTHLNEINYKEWVTQYAEVHGWYLNVQSVDGYK